MGLGIAITRSMDAKDLRRLARQEKSGRVAGRMFAIANVLSGMSRGTAAQLAEMDRQTLRDWVHRFNEKGVEGLHDRPHSDAMNKHFVEISRHVEQGAYTVIIIDGAGWHISHAMKVPVNISLLRLPAYSPELNAQENIWQYLRQNYLAARIFGTYEDILNACCHAWSALLATQGKIKSIAMRDWFCIGQKL